MHDRGGWEIKPGAVVCQPGQAGHTSKVSDYVVESVNPTGTVTVMWAEWQPKWEWTGDGGGRCVGAEKTLRRTTLQRPERITVLPHVHPYQVLDPPLPEHLKKYAK